MQRGSASCPESGGKAGQPGEKAREYPSDSAQQSLTAHTALSHPPWAGRARSALLLQLPAPYGGPVPSPDPPNPAPGAGSA